MDVFFNIYNLLVGIKSNKLLILLTILTEVLMRENYEDITNYEILNSSPIITVTECKATNTHGYIKGSLNNNTGNLIPIKYLKINLYNKDGIYLGSEYKELKNFHPNETINFDINYNYNNVDKVILGITDTMTKNENFDFFSNIEDEQLRIALPIAGLLVLYTILP